MVLPFFLSQGSPPCGGITLQVRLGKLRGGMSSNFGSMYVIIHFRKPRIHNLAVTSTIKVPRLGQLKPFTLGGPRLEGRHQLTKVGPIHLEEDFQLFRGE
jgi:hypothetical protein